MALDFIQVDLALSLKMYTKQHYSNFSQCMLAQIARVLLELVRERPGGHLYSLRYLKNVYVSEPITREAGRRNGFKFPGGEVN